MFCSMAVQPAVYALKTSTATESGFSILSTAQHPKASFESVALTSL